VDHEIDHVPGPVGRRMKGVVVIVVAAVAVVEKKGLEEKMSEVGRKT
jgi:hypothetical protein